MSVMERLEKVLETMPDDRLREFLDYAEFLSWRDENASWRMFGKFQLANAYGPNEPKTARVLDDRIKRRMDYYLTDPDGSH